MIGMAEKSIREPAVRRRPVWPLFLPQQGCPYRCVFCNQAAVTGVARRPLDPAAVADYLAERAASRRPGEAAAELAFYGGSFTALAPEHQHRLLAVVRPWLDQGVVAGIRLSTRPDALDDGLCRFLAEYGVQTVEIGLQSLDDRVLALCRRGHDAAAGISAVRLLQEHGMRVGVHLMVGLPGETTGSLLATARRLVDLGPDFVRIHPTLVVRGTELARWYAAGRYRPLSLAAAVVGTGRLKAIFEQAGIPVVRLGLQETDALRRNLVAGPHHPAFGELVAARLLFKRVRARLAAGHGPRVLRVARRDLSVLYGPGRRCWNRLAALGLLDGVRLVLDDQLPRGTVVVDSEPGGRP